MAIDPNINTRQFQSYRDGGPGLTRIGVEVEATVSGPPSGSLAIVSHDSAMAVASGSETDVLSKVFLNGGVVFLVNFSGTNKAIYRLYLNADEIDTSVTYFTNLNQQLSYNPYGIIISAGQTLKLTAEHSRPDTGDFFATFIGHEL